MASVKGKVELVGDRQQYVRLDDMVFPNPHSERMGELEWQLKVREMRFSEWQTKQADQRAEAKRYGN